MQDSDCLASQAQLACILLRREGPDFLSKDGEPELLETLRQNSHSLLHFFGIREINLKMKSVVAENLMDELERIYRRAGSRKLWSEVLTHAHKDQSHLFPPEFLSSSACFPVLSVISRAVMTELTHECLNLAELQAGSAPLCCHYQEVRQLYSSSHHHNSGAWETGNTQVADVEPHLHAYLH